MTRRKCCSGARRISRAAASLLPGALLALLPKCPMCLAAWLTVATGIGVSASAAGYIRGAIAASCIAAMALTAVRVMRPKVNRL